MQNTGGKLRCTEVCFRLADQVAVRCFEPGGLEWRRTLSETTYDIGGAAGALDEAFAEAFWATVW